VVVSGYDERHGGPYDRGAADSWYRRPRVPHYFKGATHSSPMIKGAEMTPAEIEAYNAGYADNERRGGHKEW
jgi:hypothetical protein